MGQGRGAAAKERRRQAAAARLGTSTAVSIAQPGDDTLFDVDFGRLRRVGIDLRLRRLVTPVELSWIMHALQHHLVPIIVDHEGRWMRHRDFNPSCEPRNSDALFRVTFTEMCSWREVGAFCETHHVSVSATNATHKIVGAVLDESGKERGGGVLDWCLHQEDAKRQLAFLGRCRHVRGARIVQCEDTLA